MNAASTRTPTPDEPPPSIGERLAEAFAEQIASTVEQAADLLSWAGETARAVLATTLAFVVGPLLVLLLLASLGLAFDSVRWVAFYGVASVGFVLGLVFLLFGSEEWLEAVAEGFKQAAADEATRLWGHLVGLVGRAAGFTGGLLLDLTSGVVWVYTTLCERVVGYEYPFPDLLVLPAWANVALTIAWFVFPPAVGASYDAIRAERKRAHAPTRSLADSERRVRGIVQSLYLIEAVPAATLFLVALLGGNDGFTAIRTLFEGPLEFVRLTLGDVLARPYAQTYAVTLYGAMGPWTFLPVFVALPLYGFVAARSARKRINRMRRGHAVGNEPELTGLSSLVLLALSAGLLSIGLLVV